MDADSHTIDKKCGANGQVGTEGATKAKIGGIDTRNAVDRRLLKPIRILHEKGPYN